MRTIAAIAAMPALALAACAGTPGKHAANDTDLLADPPHAQTLGEQMVAEGRGDGCLVAGNAGRNRSDGILGGSNPCRELAQMIAPPDLPEAPALLPPE